MYYLIAMTVIGFVIWFHELGHFLFAKMVGMPIKVFSVGMGPKLIAIKRGGTEYRLSMIPLGGYVLPNMEDDNEDAYFEIPTYKRMTMTIGGPLASLFLAVLCFAVLNTVSGVGFPTNMVDAINQTFAIGGNMIHSIANMFSDSTNLSGIIGIVSQGGQVVEGNWINSIYFAGLLSLNFAIVNMLPIPILDGGKLLMMLLEFVNPKAYKLQFPLSVVGLILILGLTVYTTYGDISHLLSGLT